MEKPIEPKIRIMREGSAVDLNNIKVYCTNCKYYKKGKNDSTRGTFVYNYCALSSIVFESCTEQDIPNRYNNCVNYKKKRWLFWVK